MVPMLLVCCLLVCLSMCILQRTISLNLIWPKPKLIKFRFNSKNITKEYWLVNRQIQSEENDDNFFYIQPHHHSPIHPPSKYTHTHAHWLWSIFKFYIQNIFPLFQIVRDWNGAGLTRVRLIGKYVPNTFCCWYFPAARIQYLRFHCCCCCHLTLILVSLLIIILIKLIVEWMV